MANSTAFKKGEKRPNQGRPKGTPNKVTQDVREMISAALSQAGGIDYLVERANDPKTASAFLALVGRVVPKEVVADVAVKATINWPVPAPKIET